MGGLLGVGLEFFVGYGWVGVGFWGGCWGYRGGICGVLCGLEVFVSGVYGVEIADECLYLYD